MKYKIVIEKDVDGHYVACAYSRFFLFYVILAEVAIGTTAEMAGGRLLKKLQKPERISEEIINI